MTKTETAAQLDLDRLEALARAATPGPWVHRHDPGNPAGVQHGVKLTGEFGPWVADFLDNADRSKVGGVAGDRNAQFVAAANPAAILELIAQARAQPAAAPIAPSVNSGEGAPSDDVEQRLRAQAVTPFGPEGFALLTEAAQHIADLRAQLAQQRQAEPKPRLSEAVCRGIAASHATAASVGEHYQFNSEGLDAFAIEIMDRAAAPAAPHAHAEPVAWIRKTDITELTDSEPETNGWTPLYAAPAPQEAEQASASPAGVVIPDGWKMVPIESTSKMDRAGADTLPGDAFAIDAERCWNAMLNAAPATTKG